MTHFHHNVKSNPRPLGQQASYKVTMAARLVHDWPEQKPSYSVTMAARIVYDCLEQTPRFLQNWVASSSPPPPYLPRDILGGLLVTILCLP